MARLCPEQRISVKQVVDWRSRKGLILALKKVFLSLHTCTENKGASADGQFRLIGRPSKPYRDPLAFSAGRCPTKGASEIVYNLAHLWFTLTASAGGTF